MGDVIRRTIPSSNLTLYLLFIDPTSIYIYTVNDRCDLLFDSASHQILVDHNTPVTTKWMTIMAELCHNQQPLQHQQ